jgi:hypothetical protein
MVQVHPEGVHIGLIGCQAVSFTSTNTQHRSSLQAVLAACATVASNGSAFCPLLLCSVAADALTKFGD